MLASTTLLLAPLLGYHIYKLARRTVGGLCGQPAWILGPNQLHDPSKTVFQKPVLWSAFQYASTTLPKTGEAAARVRLTLVDPDRFTNPTNSWLRAYSIKAREIAHNEAVDLPHQGVQLSVEEFARLLTNAAREWRRRNGNRYELHDLE